MNYDEFGFCTDQSVEDCILNAETVAAGLELQIGEFGGEDRNYPKHLLEMRESITDDDGRCTSHAAHVQVRREENEFLHTLWETIVALATDNVVLGRNDDDFGYGGFFERRLLVLRPDGDERYYVIHAYIDTNNTEFPEIGFGCNDKARLHLLAQLVLASV